MLSVLALIGTLPSTSRAGTVLSDNLSATSGGTEAASGSTWLTSSFGTDASSYTLNSVTLLLANSVGGKAEVDLYTDGGLQPGSFVGTLTAPGSYSSSLASTTFTTSGITLASDSTYWVVLKALSGEFDWSWTTANTGSGVGFQDTWGESDDAGATWFTYDTFPTQMSVSATSASAAVPEPTSLALFGSGAIGLLVSYLLRRRRPADHAAAQPSPCPAE
jgi:hypothetical protein